MMKKYLYLLIVMMGTTLFVMNYSVTSHEDFNKVVYQEKEQSHTITIQVAQGISLKEALYFAHMYDVDVYITKSTGSHYTKYVYGHHIIKDNHTQFDHSFTYNVKPMNKLLTDGYAFSGEAVIHGKQNILFKEALESMTHTPMRVIQDETFHLDMMKWVVLCLLAYGLLFSLLVFYDMERSSYAYGIKKLHGYDLKTFIMEKVKALIIPDLLIYMMIQIMCAGLLCQSMNHYVLLFLGKQTIMGLLIIGIMFFIIVFMMTLFDRQTTLNLLKERGQKLRILYLNQVILVILLVISGYLCRTVITQGNIILSYEQDRQKWETMKGYYIVPALTNIEDQDLFSKRNYLIKQKQLYAALNEQGGLLSDFNEFDEVSKHQGSQGYINVNYLKQWSIYDLHHKRIIVSDQDHRRVILAPVEMKKHTLIQMTKAMYKMPHGYHIIYYQKGTSFFTYNSAIISHHTNSLVNPVIQVLTSHNGTGSDYDCLLGYKYNPYKMKGTKQEVMQTLQAYGMNTYVKRMDSAYDEMSQDLHQQSMIMTGVLLTITSLMILIVVMLKVNIHMYMAVMHKRLAIMKCHGYAFKDRYRSLIYLHILTAIMLIFIGGIMHIMIYSLMAGILLTVISYYQIHCHESNVIVTALKGESYD